MTLLEKLQVPAEAFGTDPYFLLVLQDERYLGAICWEMSRRSGRVAGRELLELSGAFHLRAVHPTCLATVD